MQGSSKVAKRYAKGIMLFAKESQKEDEVYKEMNNIYNLVKESRDLRIFLNTPILDAKKKKKVAKEVFKDFSDVTIKFIELLIDHKREDILGVSANEYIALYDEQKHIEAVHITTATEISEATIQKILHKIKGLTGDNQLKVKTKIDESLIGGFIVRVGDKQIDNSIKSQLYGLTQEFSENHYIPKF